MQSAIAIRGVTRLNMSDLHCNIALISSVSLCQNVISEWQKLMTIQNCLTNLFGFCEETSTNFTQIFVLEVFYFAVNFFAVKWKSATGVQTGNSFLRTI